MGPSHLEAMLKVAAQCPQLTHLYLGQERVTYDPPQPLISIVTVTSLLMDLPLLECLYWACTEPYDGPVDLNEEEEEVLR